MSEGTRRFVIVCTEGRNVNQYVTFVGEKSYTRDLRKAARFPSEAAAKFNCCENERVSTIDDELYYG